MSNYRNVMSATRRAHRERSQPAARAKLGLLEKHKDYKERSKNYHMKEKTLKTLALKASMKNPDEFYFGMVGDKTVDGIHKKERKNLTFTGKEMKTMKNQDKNYVSMKVQQDQRSIDRSFSELQGLKAATPNSHVIFQDSHQEAENFKPEKYFDTEKELIHRNFNRPKLSNLEKSSILVNAPKDSNIVAGLLKEQRKSYEALNERMKRKRKLEEENQKVETDLIGMQKGQKRKIVIENEETGKKRIIYKFKQERKK